MRMTKLCIKKMRPGLRTKIQSQLTETSLHFFRSPTRFSHYPCASSCLGWEGPVAKATHTLPVVLSGPVLSELSEEGREGNEGDRDRYKEEGGGGEQSNRG